jgi:hypothetical protein
MAGLLAVTLVACGGSDDGTGSGPGPDWPLTGLASADSSVDVDGPVMVVKVDNTAQAFPQQGLGAADIIVEEPVEGGVTRLAVFMHSEINGVTGPVRSVRSSDIGVVSPADAVLVASGGAPEAIVDLDEAGIETRFEDTAGFARDSTRPAPYNLFVDAAQAYADLDEPGPPGPFFTFGTPALDGEPAGAIDLVFSPAQTTRLTYANGTWTRDLAEPDGFEATTVLGLLVEQGAAGYLDPSGAPVPINVTEGTGTGFMATDGQVVQVEWSKESADDPWTFSVDGDELTVPPGRTYLALLSVTTGSLQIEAPEGTGATE